MITSSDPAHDSNSRQSKLNLANERLTAMPAVVVLEGFKRVGSLLDDPLLSSFPLIPRASLPVHALATDLFAIAEDKKKTAVPGRALRSLRLISLL